MDNLENIFKQLTSIQNTQLFFLYGSMKSGTTWLQLLLDAHPAVSCRGEGHFSNKLGPFLAEAVQRYNKHIEWKNRTVFNEIDGYPTLTADHLGPLLGTAILLLMAEQSKGKAALAVGEKTPNTICGLPLFGGLFPDAKFIHIVRDGRDCTVSGWFHNLRVNPDWLRQNFPTMETYAATCADEWSYEVQLANDFAAAQPERCLTLRYEDLLTKPEELLADCLRFLGIEASGEQISACCRATSFATIAKGRQSGEEDRSSFFRKGVAGDWHNHFTPAMVQMFDAKAGAWLDRFGYRD